MTLAELVADDALDADLAALLWLLAEDGVPFVVCAPASAIAASARMGEALADARGKPDRDVERIAPDGLWGDRLRSRIRKLRPSQPFFATAEGGSLGELLERLGNAGLGDDEIRALGAVIVLDAEGRVGAAHYLRPAERDAGGHVQRRPPAVLSARHAASGALEDFSWAVTPELADRVDRSQADLERRRSGRAALLAQLAREAASEGAASRARLEAYLGSELPRERAPDHSPARPPWPDPGRRAPHPH